MAEQIEAAAEVGWTETEVGSQIVAEMVRGGGDRGHFEQIEAEAEVGWTETEVGSQIVAEAVTGEAR